MLSVTSVASRSMVNDASYKIPSSADQRKMSVLSTVSDEELPSEPESEDDEDIATTPQHVTKAKACEQEVAEPVSVMKHADTPRVAPHRIDETDETDCGPIISARGKGQLRVRAKLQMQLQKQDTKKEPEPMHLPQEAVAWMDEQTTSRSNVSHAPHASASSSAGRPSRRASLGVVQPKPIPVPVTLPQDDANKHMGDDGRIDQQWSSPPPRFGRKVVIAGSSEDEDEDDKSDVFDAADTDFHQSHRSTRQSRQSISLRGSLSPVLSPDEMVSKPPHRRKSRFADLAEVAKMAANEVDDESTSEESFCSEDENDCPVPLSSMPSRSRGKRNRRVSTVVEVRGDAIALSRRDQMRRQFWKEHFTTISFSDTAYPANESELNDLDRPALLRLVRGLMDQLDTKEKELEKAELTARESKRKVAEANHQVCDVKDALAEQKRWNNAVLVKVLEICPDVLQSISQQD